LSRADYRRRAVGRKLTTLFAALDPAWLGVGVKRTKDGFVPNAGKRKR
jgi:hypothetical protein